MLSKPFSISISTVGETFAVDERVRCFREEEVKGSYSSELNFRVSEDCVELVIQFETLSALARSEGIVITRNS